MRGSLSWEDLGKMILTRRNMKCKGSETKLNLKCLKDRNKADVAQLQELRRKERVMMLKE